MLFWPSPAQAASANGSSSIAARFAEFPKMLSVFRILRPARFLERSRTKWNSHPKLSEQRRPTPTAQAGLHPPPRRAMGNRGHGNPVSGGDGDARDAGDDGGSFWRWRSAWPA